MAPGPGVKRNAYHHYLRIRKTLELFDEQEEVMKRDIVKKLGIGTENVATIITVLLNEKVIKLVSYNVDDGHRLGVYKRIKHE